MQSMFPKRKICTGRVSDPPLQQGTKPSVGIGIHDYKIHKLVRDENGNTFMGTKIKLDHVLPRLVRDNVGNGARGCAVARVWDRGNTLTGKYNTQIPIDYVVFKPFKWRRKW